MDFLETLKQLGGIKPCEKCGGSTYEFATDRPGIKCHFCKDGAVIDLAPLLAKPYMLDRYATMLLYNSGVLSDRELMNLIDDGATSLAGKSVRTIRVVGPQRAHSLVYEVARQLGGTAMVAERIVEVNLITADEGLVAPEDESIAEFNDTYSGDVCMRKLYRYRLFSIVPDNATILLVTDKLVEKEMNEVYREAHCGVLDVLPYILCLVGPDHELDKTTQWKDGNWIGGFKVVSLHQEKA